MNRCRPHLTATFTRPGKAQAAGRKSPVHGPRPGLARPIPLTAPEPPVASTVAPSTPLELIPPPLPACHPLWGQAAALYFPL
jgi:hypothetical protein